MVLVVVVAWGADREDRFTLGIWGGGKRGEKGDVEVERWSEVGVGSTSCEVETARLGPQATPFLSGVFNLRHQS